MTHLIDIKKVNLFDSVHTRSEESWNQFLDGSTDAPVVYTTLSHRWGQYIPTKLLTENHSSFLQGIELADLPKTFREAIEVTRKLGVPYLWIDSLCIVQDSAEDWAIEASKMYCVYRNSFLNLVGAASMDATGGLFYTRNPLSIVPCAVKLALGADDKYAVSEYSPETVGSAKLDILNRAWVLQELVATPRALLFGKEELHWYCRELNATETFPERHGSEGLVASLHDKGDLWRWKAWSELIHEYSSKELTVFSDKLVAVAGLASDLGRGWNTGRYLAGLWS